MASPLPTQPISVEELEGKLKDAGNKFLKPPSSIEDLLNLLDEVELLLSKVSQEPNHSMLDALQPSMKALIGTEILRHNDTDVKVSVASCISEIARIMAPDSPYSDEEMKKFFQLSIVAIEELDNTRGRSYLKAVSVLKTFANIQLCVLMLDLELDDLIVKMFKYFLDIKSQPDAVLSDIERIMTVVVEESEEPSIELLSVLLTSVKRENQNVSPLSWELGQKVLKNCADKLASDIPKAVSSMGYAYNDYADIVASICQMPLTTDNVNVASISNSQPGDIAKEDVTQESRKKRGRKPNSLRKEEEGYDNSWIIGISSSPKMPCRGKNPKKRTFNPSNSSALEAITSLPEPAKNAHGISLTSPPSRKRSAPEDVHSRPQSRVHQKTKFNSSMNPDNGLNLLSVSAEDLPRTENEETPSRVPPKISGSTGDSSGKRKRDRGNTASQRDAKAKRRRTVRKDETERAGDAEEKHERGIIPTKTDGMCSYQETRSEFPEWQFDAMVQKGGRSAPIGHATEQPGDEFGGTSKVKKGKCTSLPKEADHGEELVGRKIKVWWPADEQFYRGVITGFDPERERHKVEYIDGDEEILHLGTERWELVEDEEDSEATEDAVIRPSANRFSSAQTSSSGPVEINVEASIVDASKKPSNSCEQSWFVRSKSKPDGAGSGKRSKRKRPAKIQSIHAELQCGDQVASTQVNVGGYKVKAANAPVLTAIFAKYGDIAARCMFTSPELRTPFLELICDIVKRLQSNTKEVIMSQLQAMKTSVCDADAARIEVSWLRQYLEHIERAEKGQNISLLKDVKANAILVAKAAKKDLAEMQLEIAAAQERARKTESCAIALELVADKISRDSLVREAEESAWREALRDLAMS